MRRPLLLTGFMATGKTTVARRLAERTGRDWVDLDRLVEERAGKSIARLFAEDGEAAFRALERTELEAILRGWAERWSAAPIVSLGGGALLERSLRLVALEAAVVVTLTAEPQEIARRVGAESTVRPLLAGGAGGALEGRQLEERIGSLLEARQVAYQEAHGLVATGGRDPDALADEVRSHWERDAVAVAAGLASYVVDIGSGHLEARLAPLVGKCSSTLLVTDTTVGALHGDTARRSLARLNVPNAEVQLDPGEEHKTLGGLERIYEAAFQAELDRSGALVGLGGGVVTDMTGFAAATWMRGVRWVGVPTTLLAMVDASVGGKTAVDFRTAKNSIGAFWQPAGVLCDVSTLLTEGERAYRSALAEVVKTALIGDPKLFELLEDQSEGVLRREPALVAEVVERCVRVKAHVVARDERESGRRAVLNLGHTVGHALESGGGFTALTHGEAVSLGLVAALRIGRRLGGTSEGLEARCMRLLQRLGLPHRLEQSALDDAARLLGHDKKRSGKGIRFVVARAVGDVDTELVALDDLVRHTRSVADPS
jgi:shikimate kinase/3-dehydroquinate synthase